MQVEFVLFRYQPDLCKDDWIPLGVVAAHQYAAGTEIGVVCMQAVSIGEASELATAILQDVPAILRKEIEGSRVRMRPGDNFLEVLRAQNPWNFHFAVPRSEQVAASDVMQAAIILFSQQVLGFQRNGLAKPTHKPSMAIHPRRLEAYEVAV